MSIRIPYLPYVSDEDNPPRTEQWPFRISVKTFTALSKFFDGQTKKGTTTQACEIIQDRVLTFTTFTCADCAN
jgi:hypothetical protein